MEKAGLIGRLDLSALPRAGADLNGVSLMRRKFCWGLALITALASALTGEGVASFTKGTEREPFADLKAGDYVWHPEISPTGPVVIIVSIPKQVLFVYRNGIRIGRSTISTGKSGHRTPTGVFTVLEKNVEHHSTLYNGALMPYMQRLTWDGVALHAGNIPGYPASHGCVRLPLDFAEKLYQVTTKGTTVVVTDGSGATDLSPQPGLLLGTANKNARAPLPEGSFVWEPEKAPSGPVSIMFSSIDREAYVYRNGEEIGRAAIGGPAAGARFGSHVYAALDKLTPDGYHEWQVLGSLDGRPPPDVNRLRKVLDIPQDFLADVHAIVTPGTTLIITDEPVNGTTKSPPGYDIMTASQ